MKAQLIAFGLIGLAATAAHARLGETRTQCISRYGIPKSELKLTDSVYDTDAQFKTEGMSVAVYFVGGKAESIAYERDCPKAAAATEAWREYEIRALLERNGGTKKWEIIPPDKPGEVSKALEIVHYLDELIPTGKAKVLGLWITNDQELIAVNFVNITGTTESHNLCIRTRRSLERQLLIAKTERLKKLEHF